MSIFGSRLKLKGKQIFTNNSAGYGGGLAFGGYDHSNVLYLALNTSVHFLNNYAEINGGAMAIAEDPIMYCTRQMTRCFFQFENIGCSSAIRTESLHSLQFVNECIRNFNVHITFVGNCASEGEDTMYGGALETCQVNCYHYPKSFYSSGLEALATLASEQVSHSIASVPFKVCTAVKVVLF